MAQGQHQQPGHLRFQTESSWVYPPPPRVPTDSVRMASCCSAPDGQYVVSHVSTKHVGCPLERGYVRAHVKLG
eukprot:328784-Pyramimonas_sp.AAC.1